MKRGERMEGFKYQKVYDVIIKDIELGYIKQHDKIPSVRTMATNLRVSKTTVENAYAQLLAEGYIYAKEKKGYYVDVSLSHRKVEPLIEEPVVIPKKYRYDFSGRSVDHESFNFDIWHKYIKRALYQKEELMRYGEPFGELCLKKALQKYSREYRGVRRPVQNFVIGAGFQTLLTHICGLFHADKVVGIAEGGFKQAEEVFKNCHMRIKKIPMDKEGISIEELKKVNIDVLYINSSSGGYHGHPIKQQRRNEILMYAKQNRVYIIEDDYNGELKFNTKPMEAMTKYDDNYSIYLGSFSKLLLPSIRISYMALPKNLLQTYQNQFYHYHQTASKLEQIALAMYIEDGQLARHLKRLRKQYAIKGNEMLEKLQQAFPNNNFHLYETSLKITMSVEEAKLSTYIAVAKEHNILVTKNSENEISLSFSGILRNDIDLAIQKLEEIWK